MKRKILYVFMICLLLLSTAVFAADEGYEINIEYEGEVTVDVVKGIIATLKGTDATPFTNVLLKVDIISGPAKPSLIAYDSNGAKIDIAEVGYWGPPTGFPVGGTFTNETPIMATFSKAGTYVGKISLVDVNNNQNVITSKEFTVEVKEAQAPENNVVENNTNTQNNVITDIPQAGVSFWVYILAIVAIVIASWAVIYFIKNKND